MPMGLRILGTEDGLPALPDFQVVMVKAREARQPVTGALADFIGETFSREAEKATRLLHRILHDCRSSRQNVRVVPCLRCERPDQIENALANACGSVILAKA